MDMDLFLNRKPKAQILTTDQEKNIFLKRQILSNYYNTLRDYKNIPHSSGFKTVCFGTKSYADRVYNQQFQGTLKIIRRLFAITLSDVENPKQDKVLKYDQPLYNEFKYKNTPILHEELAPVLVKDAAASHKSPVNVSDAPQELTLRAGPSGSAQPYSSNLDSSKKSITNKPNRAGSAFKKEPLDGVKFQPFIKLENPIPLYAGWDNDLRRFVITNRLLPRKAQIPGETQTQKGRLDRVQSSNQKLFFSAWPIKPFIQTENHEKILPTRNSRIDGPSVFAFIPLNDIKYKNIKERIKDEMRNEDFDEEIMDESTIPTNIDIAPPNAVTLLNLLGTNSNTNIGLGLEDVIPTNRGGWFWPGTDSFKFDVKQKFSTLFFKNLNE